MRQAISQTRNNAQDVQSAAERLADCGHRLNSSVNEFLTEVRRRDTDQAA